MAKSSKSGSGGGRTSYTKASNTYNRGLQRELNLRINKGEELVMRTNTARPFGINRYSSLKFEQGGVFVSTGRNASKRVFLDNDDIARLLGKPSFFKFRLDRRGA